MIDMLRATTICSVWEAACEGLAHLDRLGRPLLAPRRGSVAERRNVKSRRKIRKGTEWLEKVQKRRVGAEDDDNEEEVGGNAKTETSDLGLTQEKFLVASW